jgi:hypothetical protein
VPKDDGVPRESYIDGLMDFDNLLEWGRTYEIILESYCTIRNLILMQPMSVLKTPRRLDTFGGFLKWMDDYVKEHDPDQQSGPSGSSSQPREPT